MNVNFEVIEVRSQGSKGLIIGVLIASALSAWVTIVRLQSGDAAFTRIGVTYKSTILMYYIMGATSGSIIGALIPFAGSRVGAYLIGTIASIPIVLGVIIQKDGWPSHWSTNDTTLAPVLWVIGTLAIGSEIRRRRGGHDDAKMP